MFTHDRFELDAFLFIAAVVQTIRYKGRECLRAHQRDLRYVGRVHELVPTLHREIPGGSIFSSRRLVISNPFNLRSTHLRPDGRTTSLECRKGDDA